MQYFYIDQPAEPGRSVVLDGQEARHMCLVVRRRVGDTVNLFDRDGARYRGVIAAREGATVTVRIDAADPPACGDVPSLVLCQALPKAKKMDWVIQKSVELGVDMIVPFSARRSIPAWNARTAALKRQHWQQVALAAVKQSGPRKVPMVEAVHGFTEVVRRDYGPCLRLVLWEQEGTRTLRDALAGVSPAAAMVIMIGPEGGLCAEEVALARQHGFLTVGLGARILRTETAPVAVLSIVQFVRGNL
jgi:16S rRNA (uracil1498-N3)-methyltransferase